MITKNKYFLLLALLSTRSVFCDSELRDNTHDMTVTVQQDTTSGAPCEQNSDSESPEQQQQEGQTQQEKHALRKKLLRGLQLSWEGAKAGAIVCWGIGLAGMVEDNYIVKRDYTTTWVNNQSYSTCTQSNQCITKVLDYAIAGHKLWDHGFGFALIISILAALENELYSCNKIKNFVKELFAKRTATAEDNAPQDALQEGSSNDNKE